MIPMKAAEYVKDALVSYFGADETVELMIWDAKKCAEMGYGNGQAAIVWEGAPDPEWAIPISMSSWVLSLPGILAEPYNGHILNFYKA
ncbi:MAG: hypothetical protein IID38_02695 [Planctomycetes bacterium]|nr:hypothetical protein [Planctomycetota bacterium]